MDRKSIIILVICFILIVVWMIMFPRWFPQPPPTAYTNQVVTGRTQTNKATETTTNAGVTTTPGGVSSAGSHFVAHPEIPEQLLVVTNNNAQYTFTSRGGGLQQVELIGYPETVATRRRLAGHPTNQWATLNAPTVPPVFALLGDESLQGDNVYKLTRTTGGVRAEKALPNGLTVVKDFQLSTNFLVNTTIRLENNSGHEITIPSYEWSAGTSTPMNPTDNGLLGQFVLWHNGSKSQQVGLSFFNTNTTKLFGLLPRTPETEYRAGDNNVVWSSAQNQFFALATMPEKPVQSVVVHMVDLPGPTPEELKEHPSTVRNPRGLESALVYPGLKLAPGAAVTNHFNLFAGPKEYQTLAYLAARFNNDIDAVMNFGWFGAISKALLVVMNWLHGTTGLSYGLAIILITIILKAIFWPLTQASTRSAKRMQALQPQLKALQEKYKDEPQKFAAKQWEFYKQNKVNPMSGCLPMLLQVPVFIGFYSMLRTAIELRGASFLWIGDLSRPDTVYSLHLPLHVLGLADLYFPINPMPLLMGLTMLWQARMAPMSPSVDPQQQKMMKYMPLFMLAFMYNLSSGLAVYWTTNNLLTLLQTKLTKMQPDTTTPAAATAKPAGRVAPQKKKK